MKTLIAVSMLVGAATIGTVIGVARKKANKRKEQRERSDAMLREQAANSAKLDETIRSMTGIVDAMRQESQRRDAERESAYAAARARVEEAKRRLDAVTAEDSAPDETKSTLSDLEARAKALAEHAKRLNEKNEKEE